MKLIVVETENFKVDGGAMFGVIPKSMWQKVYPADENNMCNLANRCLLIDTGNRRILVDTGIGNKHDEKFLSHIYVNGDGNLLKSLEKSGYSTNDITDVIFTHLHWDHCAGATYYNEKHELCLTFPYATYWASQKQWDWAMTPNTREKAAFQKENLIPLQQSGLLRLLHNDIELFPNIHIRITDGHTMGMISLIIRTEKHIIALPADLIPTAAHIQLPWISAYDIQPMVLLHDKTQFLNQAVEQNWVLFFEHDIFYRMLYCTKNRKRF